MNRSTKSIMLLMFILGAIVASVYICTNYFNANIEYLFKESYLHDFSIDGKNVYLRCDIRVKNPSDKTVKFFMLADVSNEKMFLEDVIYGYSSNNVSEKQIFIIEPHTTKTFKDVIFKGSSTNYTSKSHRLPPNKISLQLLE